MFANLSHLLLAVDAPSLTNAPSASQGPGWANILLIVAIVAAVMIVPFLIGNFVARMLRMPDHGWRIGLIVFSFAVAIAVIGTHIDFQKRTLQLRLGVDLKGGVILIYEVDEQQSDISAETGTASGQGNFMPGLIAALGQRLNPDGLKEIVIRPYGERSVEITVPDATELEIKQLKDLIVKAGVLEFHIVANRQDHETIISLAEKQLEAADRSTRLQRRLLDERGSFVGLWARVARDKEAVDGHRRFTVDVVNGLVRDSRTGQKVDFAGGTRAEEQLAERGIEDLDILMAVEENPDDRVTGEHLGVVRSDNDSTMRPCISFTMNGPGTRLMRTLTRDNLPDSNGVFFRHLGIVMDGELLSAPRIQSIISNQGQITGGFEQAEVDFLVGILRAGRLQTTLKKNPLSEDRIGSTLGDDTIRSGVFAIIMSLVVVLAFIQVYYRFSGLVACVVLLANLLFTMALVILLKATVTLPGLAGIVLTVGMAVDSNVLIYERIREELARGAALRMAIRNGFSRATITIVDSNLTTLLTAVILYWIGTDQVRGFAVTLILGILTSMFTAIFCARVALEIAERGFHMKTLKMFQLFGDTRIDFVGKRALWIGASLVLIVIGIVGVAIRGGSILDTDFRGGTKVTMLLEQPMTYPEVNAILKTTMDGLRVQGESVSHTLHRIDMAGRQRDTVWRVETSIPNQMERDDKSVVDGVEFVQDQLKTKFKLARYEMGDPEDLQERVAEGANASSGETKGDSLDQGQGNDLLVQESSGQPTGDENKGASSSSPPPSESPTSESPTSESPAPSPIATPGSASSTSSHVRTTGKLTFGNAIKADVLIGEIIEAGEKLNIVLSPSDVQLENPQWNPEVQQGFRDWTVTLSSTKADASRVLGLLKEELNSTPIWPASSSIGGQVAANMQAKALIALVASLIMITIYVWVRFQHLIFGIAAVVALIHDVLITVGAIALSYWLAGTFGFLMIDEFKISLPVVAALLTLVGYSINDTIVVFDRIREVRGKSPKLTAEMVNISVNQTLSRTVLTFFTTWIVTVVLYIWGGEGIHGFAFCLLVGLVTGTYSTIFIAAPLALWVLDVQKPTKHVSQSVREKSTA